MLLQLYWHSFGDSVKASKSYHTVILVYLVMKYDENGMRLTVLQAVMLFFKHLPRCDSGLLFLRRRRRMKWRLRFGLVAIAQIHNVM